MVGASYVAYVQWQAATMGSKYLKAIVPRVIGHSLYELGWRQGGALLLAASAMWALRHDARTRQDIFIYNWEQLFRKLPLIDLDREAGKDVPFFRDWIAHPDYDDYWRAQSIEERYQDIEIPVLQIGGWYDVLVNGTFHNFTGMRESGGSELARANQRAIVGPWIHDASSMTNAGEVDFGRDSKLDLQEIELRWFDHWLKGEDNGAERDAPLRIFVMGTNEWRDEQDWPLARTRFTPYYFHSGGEANSLQGDGGLSPEPPADEPPDHYVYNPAFPVPTRGGNTCCNPELVPWGAYDQRPLEYRTDILVYTSEPLAEDLEVTGPVVVKLYASTDGRDTDFTAKLVDVHPDGYAVNLCDNILRARYHESREYQKLLEPGEVYEFTIDLWVTSNVFFKGHRIRVDISSSNFPRFDRNPNTGNEFGRDAELRVAHQTVLHDRAHSSNIVLPLIPAQSPPA
jgi:putative CocE/NonD family hydrolase